MEVILIPRIHMPMYIIHGNHENDNRRVITSGASIHDVEVLHSVLFRAFNFDIDSNICIENHPTSDMYVVHNAS